MTLNDLELPFGVKMCFGLGIQWVGVLAFVKTVLKCVDLSICSVCQKNPPKVFWHFPQTVGNFGTKFYKPIARSYLRSSGLDYKFLLRLKFDLYDIFAGSRCNW